MESWKQIRYQLLNALRSIQVADIYLIEKENTILTICVIAEGLGTLRPLTRMMVVDNLIKRNEPDLYTQYFFCYEIWERNDWEKQPAAKFFHR